MLATLSTLWHSGFVSDIPRNQYRKYSVNENGDVLVNLMPAGESLLAASALLVPTPEETRKSLLRIRRMFKISRAQLAVALGVGKHTLRRWESAERLPSTAARRLVQLVEVIFFNDASLLRRFDTLVVGRIDLQAVEKTRRELLPASAHGFLNRLRRDQTKPTAHNDRAPSIGNENTVD